MQIRIETPIANLTAELNENQVMDLLQTALGYATGRPAEVRPPIVKFADVMNTRKNQDVPQNDQKPDPDEVGYKGFLYIKCEECGNTKGYCAKSPRREHRCDCGHETPLSKLKPMYVKCECGEKFKYMTNLTENTATMNCIGCGAPVDLEYHGKKGVYETIE